MPELNPPEAQLGFSSPALGPWIDSAVTLGAPAETLAVPMPDPFVWRPPASGLLSLLVRNDQEPALLRGLKQADGTAAFTEGSLVALFRLMPEVEERLDALLSDFVPSADGAAAAPGTQRRARVRHLAIEIGNGARLDPAIWQVVPAPPADASPAEQARYLGLELAGDVLRNSDRPMRDLKRPGRFGLGGSSAVEIVLEVGQSADDVFLWAFDDRGLAIDPGAVAAWWSALAVEQFENQFLWAPGLQAPGELRTASVQAERTVHLVDPHEGRADELGGEVTAGGLQGAGRLRRQVSPTTPVELSLPSPEENRPRRVALLPNGTYAGQVTLWPAGTNFPSRDFVRVALVDVDRHLVGAPSPPGSEEEAARARPVVRPNAEAVLLETIDDATGAIHDVLDGGGERFLVTSVLDADWGAFSETALSDITEFPNGIDDPDVVGLLGGGEADGGTIGRQRVLVDFTLGPDLVGTWVRVWPQGFDADTARHVRLNGGAAPVRPDGQATVVVELPPGRIEGSVRMGLDVLVASAAGSRLYTDLRFDRPTPVPGAPIAVGAAQGPFTVCETGLIAVDEAALTTPGRVPPGATVVSRGGQPALVDPASLGSQHLTDDAVLRLLTPGLSVSLTAPAFRGSPRGSSVAALSAGGANVEEVPRNGTSAVTAPGAAHPGQERLDVAAGRVEGQDVQAALATAPALGRFHERLPHQAGHPGVPASDELHGTGAVLSGPAAVPAIEYLRDRAARPTLPDLFEAARSTLPVLPDPPGPVRWTALLRTVSPGVEGEPGLGLAVEAGPFPFGQSLEQMLAFFASLPIGLPAGIDALIPEAEAVARALDRRVFAAAHGLRDGLRSLRAALARAEHFVYVETPAIDTLAIGGEDVSPWSALMDRLVTHPGLHVLVCHPVHLLPGTPLRLEHVRNELLRQLPPGDGRVELFSVNTGPARSLRQSSTTVVVDDAYAMTGSAHLWRRGLTFDSSISVALFDERLERGRPREIRAFRRNLLAGRLGISVAQLPEEPGELLLAIRQLRKRGGAHRLATEPKSTPELRPTPADIDAWNSDGHPQGDLGDWLSQLLALLQSGTLAETLGSELTSPSGG